MENSFDFSGPLRIISNRGEQNELLTHALMETNQRLRNDNSQTFTTTLGTKRHPLSTARFKMLRLR